VKSEKKQAKKKRAEKIRGEVHTAQRQKPKWLLTGIAHRTPTARPKVKTSDKAVRCASALSLGQCMYAALGLHGGAVDLERKSKSDRPVSVGNRRIIHGRRTAFGV